jgi:hypothetical protein
VWVGGVCVCGEQQQVTMQHEEHIDLTGPGGGHHLQKTQRACVHNDSH